MSTISIAKSRKTSTPCTDCRSFQLYVYGVVIGEDNRHYMIPFDAVYCHVCGKCLEVPEAENA